VDDPADVETRPVPAPPVTDVRTSRDGISFSVEQPGTPVLVKTSYFPNWKVEGGLGPWRVTPNLMVVVPTGTEVELRYRTTSVEWLGWAVTLVALGALVLLARARPVPMPAPPARRRSPAEISAELQAGIDAYLADLEAEPGPGRDPDGEDDPDVWDDPESDPGASIRPQAG
jgi:hypothetical protein